MRDKQSADPGAYLTALFDSAAVRSAIRRSCQYDEDIEGDVWLRIVRKVKAGTIPRNATPGYFARMARHVFIDNARREQGRRAARLPYPIPESYESSSERDIDIRRFFERSADTPIEGTTVDEIAVRVAARFRLEYRLIWLLAWEGHRQKAIAETLGKCPAFVCRALQTIRAELRRQFEEAR